ncbi:glycosyltransferase family 39 protein [Candidatus Saccharibacteria bacterium]|nr:glycosyltransferase family 39 protein [Candidatus Saccharibacteria bacterium]
MKKIVISKLFLYKYRFIIGYIILGIAFVWLMLMLPFFSQNGLSEAEMASAESSFALEASAPLEGNLVDLPYHLLQKLSIKVLGLTPYAIKLPSILVGLVLGLLLILLLNRWFKNNVSLLASCLVILSTPFLFLAGSGTPLIMAVFWPTLLLWLGSKIQGEKRPKPIYSFWFGVALLLAIFTPYMIYFAIFSVLFVLFQPHLRFIVKSLPKVILIGVGALVITGITLLMMNIINRPDTIQELMFAKGFEPGMFLPNLWEGMRKLFSWWGTQEGVFLTPLVSLPIFALMLTGLFSTTKGFFASRNSIATVLILFTVVITGFSSDRAVFLILPASILVAHGLKYILEKWYGLFPENPYARVAAVLPLTLLYCVMIVPSLAQYVYGYRYNPEVADLFSYDLAIIRDNLTDETLVVGAEAYDFYHILEHSTNIKVVMEAPSTEKIAFLHARSTDSKYQLSRIITSPRKENSDIMYLYTVKGE